MMYEERCYKLSLPNGCIVDVLSEVIGQIRQYLQISNDAPESGGYIFGYQHKSTGNITLECVSTPQNGDNCGRIHFMLQDLFHFRMLRKMKRQQSYYMGTWHTHPQKMPAPSSVDLLDWKESIKKERTGSNYIFFIIAGTEHYRMWVADLSSAMLSEVLELPIHDMLYTK